MESFQVIVEKMRFSSKRSSAILVSCLITLSVLLLVTVMYQNSTNFNSMGKPSKASNSNAHHFTANSHNVTCHVLEGNPCNVTATAKAFEDNPHNVTSMILEGSPSNVTHKVLADDLRNVTANNQHDDGTSNSSAGSYLNTTSAAGIGSGNVSFGEPTIGTSQPAAINSDEKLLRGLIIPGFNEGSCLSRYQSYLYRKKKGSPHKPSQYLISKLRAYEALHKRCGPLTNIYKKTIRELAKSSHINGTTKCNYIVWIPSNGLGNRMLSIAAAFLYSVLTDRILLVDFGPDMIDLFCEPFPNSTWLLPKEFPHRDHHKNLPTYESLLKGGENSSDNFLHPTFLYLKLSHGNEDHVKFFQCDHSQSLLEKVPAFILLSDQYFVPSLFMVPSFKEELNKMFPNKETVFHLLGHYLYHPSNEAWGLITRFYQAYLAKADERIGLQIRVFGGKKVHNETVMEEIVDCTKKKKLLPEIGDLAPPPTSTPKSFSSKAVLVTSLSQVFSENLRTMYWMNPTMTGEIIEVYQPSHDEYQKFNDGSQTIRAWTEIYLLSLCDKLMTSAQSTFGYVAQSLGGLKPWILYKAVDGKAAKHLCQKALSMEPCYHFPPDCDCKTKAKLDIGSLYPYMRPCEDFNFGVKMISET